MIANIRRQHSTVGLPPIGPGVAVHFTGIGGIGMSGLAHLCLQLGAQVTGADNRLTDLTAELGLAGAQISAGPAPELVKRADILVYSSAVDTGHPERKVASELGIPMVRRGTMLAHLLAGKRLYGVAGTHGKTSTAAMLTTLFRGLGSEPFYFVGGRLPNLGTHAAYGQHTLAVVETDESDGAFLELDPELVLVTNIDRDHMEYYGGWEQLCGAFGDYLELVEIREKRIVCADCPTLMDVAVDRCGTEFISYGFSSGAMVQGLNPVLTSEGSACQIVYEGVHQGVLSLPVPGQKMLLNALGVCAVGLLEGYGTEQITAALSSYRSPGRRFEVIGTWRGAQLVDDYAHHPTEVLATLETLEQVASGRRIAVFQPHRYSRLEALMADFSRAFEKADMVLITDVYSAGEQEREGVSGLALASSLVTGAEVHFVASLEQVEEFLRAEIRSGDSVLFMGAGDVTTLPRKLAAEEK